MNIKKIQKILIISLIMNILLPSVLQASTSFIFTKDLSRSTPSNDPDVKQLQIFLTNQGLYSGPITGNFLSLTSAGVKAFQTREGITPISGYFGVLSRTRANQILANNVTTNTNIQTISASTTNNLILNPSLESVDPNNINLPDKWQNGSFGTNSTTFTYPIQGPDGLHAANISMKSYLSGDAKWFFNDVAVTAGQKYSFSEYYMSNVMTYITARFKTSNGSYTYLTLDTAPIATNWSQRTISISVPKDTVSMTIFHSIKSVGTLSIDSYSLTNTNLTQTVTAQTNTTQTSTSTNTLSKVTNTIIPVTNTNISGITWGAYTGQTINDLNSFETLVGKQVKIYSTFYSFADDFPLSYSSTIGAKGKTILIFWEPTTGYDDINSGSQDAQIKKFASDAKTYGYPVILAPFHEMNGNWDVWDGTIGNNTPAKFILAWKRIKDIFSGVSNVKFALVYNSDSQPNVAGNQFEDYYPGNDYVDYIGIDGFNSGNPWQTFQSIFATPISKLSSYNKPIYILSMGSVQGSQKSSWIADALTVQIPKYTQIKGWVWFNQNKEQNWLINSDPDSLNTFKASLPN